MKIKYKKLIDNGKQERAKQGICKYYFLANPTFHLHIYHNHFSLAISYYKVSSFYNRFFCCVISSHFILKILLKLCFYLSYPKHTKREDVIIQLLIGSYPITVVHSYSIFLEELKHT